ncbi:hypothetical protein PR048_027194 [Dryococelus australis]|uniref:Uncharacterized protein n=1 Tax=Dryococelus australis TaxID=614101 RepID=A0ABQ9GES7_9NEOP|nr:hypothetical protein PR048_027194 [Dryococelus australis]
MPCRLDSTVLCTLEPQMFVHCLMPQCYLTPDGTISRTGKNQVQHDDDDDDDDVCVMGPGGGGTSGSYSVIGRSLAMKTEQLAAATLRQFPQRCRPPPPPSRGANLQSPPVPGRFPPGCSGSHGRGIGNDECSRGKATKVRSNRKASTQEDYVAARPRSRSEGAIRATVNTHAYGSELKCFGAQLVLKCFREKQAPLHVSTQKQIDGAPVFPDRPREILGTCLARDSSWNKRLFICTDSSRKEGRYSGVSSAEARVNTLRSAHMYWRLRQIRRKAEVTVDGLYMIIKAYSRRRACKGKGGGGCLTGSTSENDMQKMTIKKILSPTCSMTDINMCVYLQSQKNAFSSACLESVNSTARTPVLFGVCVRTRHCPIAPYHTGDYPVLDSVHYLPVIDQWRAELILTQKMSFITKLLIFSNTFVETNSREDWLIFRCCSDCEIKHETESRFSTGDAQKKKTDPLLERKLEEFSYIDYRISLYSGHILGFFPCLNLHYIASHRLVYELRPATLQRAKIYEPLGLQDTAPAPRKGASSGHTSVSTNEIEKSLAHRVQLLENRELLLNQNFVLLKYNGGDKTRSHFHKEFVPLGGETSALPRLCCVAVCRTGARANYASPGLRCAALRLPREPIRGREANSTRARLRKHLFIAPRSLEHYGAAPGTQDRGKRDIPEKTRRPATKSYTIPTYGNAASAPPTIGP